MLSEKSVIAELEATRSIRESPLYCEGTISLWAAGISAQTIADEEGLRNSSRLVGEGEAIKAQPRESTKTS